MDERSIQLRQEASNSINILDTITTSIEKGIAVDIDWQSVPNESLRVLRGVLVEKGITDTGVIGVIDEYIAGNRTNPNIESLVVTALKKANDSSARGVKQDSMQIALDQFNERLLTAFLAAWEKLFSQDEIYEDELIALLNQEIEFIKIPALAKALLERLNESELVSFRNRLKIIAESSRLNPLPGNIDQLLVRDLQYDIDELTRR